ncbi:MAG: hypothetical protein ACOX4H_04850 [Bacillota bacterium]
MGWNSGEVSGWIVRDSLISGKSNFTGGIVGNNVANSSLTGCQFINSSVEGLNYGGGIAGANDGEISNCFVSGKKSDKSHTVYGGSNLGGIAGSMQGTITGSTVSGASIFGDTGGYDINAGGIVGEMTSGNVSGCTVTETQIKIRANSGGIVGKVSQSGCFISNCVSEDSVTVYVRGDFSTSAGPIVGDNYTTLPAWIEKCTGNAVIETY